MILHYKINITYDVGFWWKLGNIGFITTDGHSEGYIEVGTDVEFQMREIKMRVAIKSKWSGFQ